MKTTMHNRDVEKRIKLLERYDYLCIICGHGFRDIASVSCEHLVPACFGGHGGYRNLAPSHFQCNNIRGNGSIIEASKKIEQAQRRFYRFYAFYEWLNKKAPSRFVAPEYMDLSVFRPDPIDRDIQ